MATNDLIVFFDGECPLCIGWVKFLLDRDGYNRLRFASLQSGWSRQFFMDEDLPHPGMESVAVWDGRVFHFGSEAILEILSALPGVWKYLERARSIPRKQREQAYAWIAANRNRWFDRRSACWIPSPEDQLKFLDLETLHHPERAL